MRTRYFIIGLVLLALMLNGCVTRRATDFEFVLYQGADVLGSESIMFSDVLAQGKPVVLAMWASSCPSCRIDMTLLEQASADYGDEVLIVGLHIGHFVNLGTEEGALAFLEDEGITFPNGFTPKVSVVRDYEVLEVPSIYYIKPSGKILSQTYGLVRDDALRDHIDELIAASSG
ncbi:MAG: TlpA family protein disulfide reductase [Anaerolineae bacterium]|nr:TlpA family protein disulfide reductase [Anaerolineae bacterium]